MAVSEKLYRDREILRTAQQRGTLAVFGSYLRLSGPGWLQSAITLGGGSLGGALYLGAIGGTSMLWVNLVAIFIGIVMLSAISYVTLSTGHRPYQAIYQHINPVLAIGWVAATILANMIFIIAQFSLCYDVAKSNFGWETLMSDTVGMNDWWARFLLSAIFALVALGVVLLSLKPGWMSRLFDIVLKLLVGLVVACFVIAVVQLARQDAFRWGEILWGLVPDLNRWFTPAPALAELLNQIDDLAIREFWEGQLVANQRKIMIGAAATAVGINMTFLLPYSLLARGWDKPFRGLARWDLMTGMAIPFIFVTGSITLAAANAFHARIDDQFASRDITEFQQSPLFQDSPSTLDLLSKRIAEFQPEAFADVDGMNRETEAEIATANAAQKQRLAQLASALSVEEKQLAVALARPNTRQLANTLQPVLGERSNYVFGLGALGMGFSTIIVLMLINGYAFAELSNRPNDPKVRMAGSVAAVIMGFCWIWIWTGASRTWLLILTANFAIILLPIAYLAFFLMMNSPRLMGVDKPTGARMYLWNVLMLLGIAGAATAAIGSLTSIENMQIKTFVLGALSIFGLLALIGFFIPDNSELATKTATDNPAVKKQKPKS